MINKSTLRAGSMARSVSRAHGADAASVLAIMPRYTSSKVIVFGSPTSLQPFVAGLTGSTKPISWSFLQTWLTSRAVRPVCSASRAALKSCDGLLTNCSRISVVKRNFWSINTSAKRKSSDAVMLSLPPGKVSFKPVVRWPGFLSSRPGVCALASFVSPR